MKPKIAVAAYGAWIMAEENPPSLILTELEKRSWAEFDLLALHTPVEGAKLRPMLEALLQDPPLAIIGVGLAAGSPVIRPETTAINMLDYRVPDASGACPRGAPVVEGGPVGYRSDLPNAQIVERLRAAQIPAQISHAAGTHCCNQMLYLARHLIAAHGAPTRAGFIHVPYTHAHIAALPPGSEPQPSMALATMVEALDIVLRTVASAGGAQGGFDLDQ